MNATLRRSRALVVVVGFATLLAACGSSSKSSSVEHHDRRRWRDEQSSAPSTAPARRSRRPSTKPSIAAFQDANTGMTVNYNPSGSGSGKSALQTKTVDFAGTDSLPKPADLSSYQGGTVLNFPTVAAPITVSYNLSGVKKLQLSGTTLAKIFAIEDQEVERRRDRGRQPRRDAAVDCDHRRAPLRQLGHDDELHEVPRRRRQAPTGRSAAVTPSTGRRSARRRAARRTRASPRSSSRPTARSATSTSPTPLRPASRTPRSRTRPASSSPRPSPARQAAVANATFNADLSYDPIERVGRRRRTRSPRRRGSSPTRSRRSTTTGTMLKEFLHVHLRPRPDARTAPSATRRCRPSTVQKAVAQLSKFQIPAS